MQIICDCDLLVFFLPENQKAGTEKLHLCHNVNTTFTRNPLSKEVDHAIEANLSSEKKKGVGRKNVSSEGSSREKEMESVGFVSKEETIPEVQALLARLRAL